MVVMIILAPIWSAFTDAYTKQDYDWMKAKSARLEKLGLLSLPILILLIIFSPIIFELWLGESLGTSFQTSIAIAIYIYSKIMGAIYMHPINGTGKVRLQLITYITIATIAIPAMTYSCRYWGLTGIILVPTLAFFVQAIISRIQLNKIINNKATGIWNK